MAEHNGSATATDRPVAELIKELSDQTTTLVRQELELAKVELTEKGKQAGIGAGMFGAAGMLGLYALGALTAAAILALGLVVAGWLAALIVAGAWGLIAGGLALTGKGRVSRGVPPTPEQTVETVKEDVEYTRQRALEGRR
ncbi:MAG TPA: phage holin family protein [Solirubrobacteraceae bacterium]|nr:phage holin family protein [Solirubrobacteraceae bacterium]